MKTDSRLNYMRPILPRYGLLQISGIAKILETNLRAKTFEELRIPFYVAATNLNYGKIEYFSKGELLNPVIASSSIPVLFKPVIIKNNSYVDGGVMDNLPIKPIENLCRFFIGSFVNPSGYQKSFSSLIDIAERTFTLNLLKEALEKSKRFNFYIGHEELSKYSVLETAKANEVFNIGYKATKDLIKTTDILNILFSPGIKDS
jgi:NTE family protein